MYVYYYMPYTNIFLFIIYFLNYYYINYLLFLYFVKTYNNILLVCKYNQFICLEMRNFTIIYILIGSIFIKNNIYLSIIPWIIMIS